MPGRLRFDQVSELRVHIKWAGDSHRRLVAILLILTCRRLGTGRRVGRQALTGSAESASRREHLERRHGFLARAYIIGGVVRARHADAQCWRLLVRGEAAGSTEGLLRWQYGFSHGPVGPNVPSSKAETLVAEDVAL